jgi:hypothetical protein
MNRFLNIIIVLLVVSVTGCIGALLPGYEPAPETTNAQDLHELIAPFIIIGVIVLIVVIFKDTPKKTKLQ